MQNPFAKAIRKHAGKEPDVAAQAALGRPRATGLADEHARFLRMVLALIDAGRINLVNPHSFIHGDVYDGLPADQRAKTDRAVPNIVSLLERIMDLHARPEKDESIEMKNLIETLWQSKERIERHADVFIF